MVKQLFSRVKGFYRHLNKAKSGSGHQTATRLTLDPSWQESQQNLDWMSVPTMADYVNKLVSGRGLDEGGHWAIYARERHVLPMQAQRKGKIEMVSLACGSGHIETSLIEQFGWPITNFLGLEFDDALRTSASERFSKIPTCDSRFEYFDFNAPDFPKRKFDIVFACHALHHATDIEGLLEKINGMLKPDGLIIGIDFFGPSRFQIEYDVLPMLEELYISLPPDLRRDLRTPAGEIQDTFTYDTIERVRKKDPSESVRSSDLRTLLFSTFPVIEIKPMGGTLLRWIFNNRAGNYDVGNPYHLAVIRLLQLIESEMITLQRIKSDDLFFVLGKSNRIKG